MVRERCWKNAQIANAFVELRINTEILAYWRKRIEGIRRCEELDEINRQRRPFQGRPASVVSDVYGVESAYIIEVIVVVASSI